MDALISDKNKYIRKGNELEAKCKELSNINTDLE
jgi:hypothetical protein